MTFLLVVRQSYHCSVKTKKSPRLRRPSSLSAVRAAIVGCERCPRLRQYCRAVAATKRAAYRDWEYWGKPVPGFGDPEARILILGLAPAAHGANRTGRVFTGDGVGGSGDFLMAALYRAGLANLPDLEPPGRWPDAARACTSRPRSAARRRTTSRRQTEVTTCLDHLESELAHLPRLDTVVALGKIAWDAWLQLVGRHAPLPKPAPGFGAWRDLHAAEASTPASGTPDGPPGALRTP